MSEQTRENERRRRLFNFIGVMEGAILLALGGLTTVAWQTREAVVRLTVQMESMQSLLGEQRGIPERMSRAEVRIEALERRQTEKEQMRGLK